MAPQIPNLGTKRRWVVSLMGRRL